ncbi:bifunctional adenosylcobinamide kinase/adenosylcobinamide-phosphate guanylyltransferase [Pseudomonas sp. F1_0610]|uniref:bifunctional adenosylcobinamide kinase/adenosylcobinamide-phosphate guanylyltransferase n=1 Tax=Pseudomonas sp. F1_0610 TaxID=3114284 RepID=UPI0039C2FD86
MSYELILGGARSGKSRLAEQLAQQVEGSVCYIATAQALDAEMQARIAQHKAQRPSTWALCEEPIYLAEAIEQNVKAHACVLVDCLTLWLTNLLLTENRQLLNEQIQALQSVLVQQRGHIILVSNETGLGVVPMGELSRQYVDQAGWLHQALAQEAQRVIFTVAGLPMVLKGAALACGGKNQH